MEINGVVPEHEISLAKKRASAHVSSFLWENGGWNGYHIFMQILWIGLGGMVGTMARFGLVSLVGVSSFSLGTYLVNILGSGLLGFVYGKSQGMEPMLYSALAVGVMGGFTTYSAFSLEVVHLLRDGRMGAALMHFVLMGSLSISFCGLGLYLAK